MSGRPGSSADEGRSGREGGSGFLDETPHDLARWATSSISATDWPAHSESASMSPLTPSRAEVEA